MKLHSFTLAIAATILSISGATVALKSPAGAISTPSLIAQASNPSGMFVAGEHPTQGIARIVRENGKTYLEFNDNFQTDRGPDLFVLLHRSNKPERYSQADYVNLGRLQNIKGTQRYLIPNNVNLANYRSAVIWCRRFNATFGYAPLNSSSQMTMMQ